MADSTISSELYERELFVERWDELIDWEGRARGAGDFCPKLCATPVASASSTRLAGRGTTACAWRREGFEMAAADGKRGDGHKGAGQRASARRRPAGAAGRLDGDTDVLDLGSGYAVSTRLLAREYGCRVRQHLAAGERTR